MIAASHSEQKPRVMRKTVRQPVYGRHGRQPNSKETATDFWIAHYATNLIQRFRRHCGIGVQKPQNIAMCSIGSEIHLPGPAALAGSNNLVAEAFSKSVGTVSARTIDDNNFRPTGSVSQVRKKRTYQRRFIQDWNDNGDLHLWFCLNFRRAITHQKMFSK
jgi:hypothetical protein